MTRTAVILAGGQARRFGGQDKGEIEFDGRRLFDHVYQRVSTQVDQVFISGHHNYNSDLENIPDLDTGPKGPLAGLYAAMTKLRGRDGFLTVPIDGPFLPKNLYDRLSGLESSISQGPERIHPTFAYWRIQDLQSSFTVGQPPRSLTGLAEAIGARPIKFEHSGGFININSAQDLERLQDNKPAWGYPR